MNLSDFGQTEETVVSLATVPNGLFKNAFRSGVPMLSISCVPMQFIIAVCAPCALHANPGPVVRSRTHGGFQGGARAQGARRQVQELDIG